MTPATPRSANPANLAAIARWPNVPACYGWLSLDRRGAWRLQGEIISHPGLIAFLNANYFSDENGNWLVQNGPQRVYVTLDYLPLVLRIAGDGQLHTHTGDPCRAGARAFIDDEGNGLIETDAGPGLVDDRDLASFLAAVVDAHGRPADEAVLAAIMQGDDQVPLFWKSLPVLPLKRAEAAQRLGFQPSPAAAE